VLEESLVDTVGVCTLAQESSNYSTPGEGTEKMGG
jgi:hypothetical protein